MFEVIVEASFAAAHSLRGYQGKCSQVHGHNFRVRVTAEGEKLNELGLLVDFTVLKGRLRQLVERFDHENLNGIPPFDVLNPSTENIARYLAVEMQVGMPEGVRVSSVWVQETDANVAVYRP